MTHPEDLINYSELKCGDVIEMLLLKLESLESTERSYCEAKAMLISFFGSERGQKLDGVVVDEQLKLAPMIREVIEQYHEKVRAAQ